jgi:P-type Cu+ transporter
MEHMHERAHEQPDSTRRSMGLKDPVCGMAVRSDSPHRVTLDGDEYRFCSESCLTKFRGAPARYTGDGQP